MEFAGGLFSLPQATTLTIDLLDCGNGVLQSQTLAPASEQTLLFNQVNVASVRIDFTGGSNNFYGEGRDHAWYTIDNITYEIGSTVELPEPGGFLLFALTVAGLGFSRRRTKI